ncbi:hypothetical protein P7K49_003327 [Saguinus oedipus]|uniref:Uncharacterized protein n=1 Tax=Saguinus oedipus TaxID=9490 RepID=A0ABQ9WKS4_SAGOE|nr:hypothetical protein P7K49_003327 [Saguinus oedipus]
MVPVSHLSGGETQARNGSVCVRSDLGCCGPRAVAAGGPEFVLYAPGARAQQPAWGPHREVEPADGPKCRKPRGLAPAQGSRAEEIGLEGAGEGPYVTVFLPPQDVIQSHHVLPPASPCASQN